MYIALIEARDTFFTAAVVAAVSVAVALVAASFDSVVVVLEEDKDKECNFIAATDNIDFTEEKHDRGTFSLISKRVTPDLSLPPIPPRPQADRIISKMEGASGQLTECTGVKSEIENVEGENGEKRGRFYSNRLWPA